MHQDTKLEDKMILQAFIFLVGIIIGAMSHEVDIYNACATMGESSYAMWTNGITCTPKEVQE